MRAKPASQKRSQEKRDRILRAMDTLLKRKPFEEVSVSELASKAKVSPATIYQRFSNIDATASVLMELYFLKVEEWANQAPQKSDAGSLPLFDSLLVVANHAYDQISSLGYVMRPAYLYSRKWPDRVGPEWARLEKLAVSGFESFLRTHAAEIADDKFPKAASLICYFFNFMLLGPLLHNHESHWQALRSRKAFTHSLAKMAYRYLIVSDNVSAK
jgi:AcrR family transcriptional regulator